MLIIDIADHKDFFELAAAVKPPAVFFTDPDDYSLMDDVAADAYVFFYADGVLYTTNMTEYVDKSEAEKKALERLNDLKARRAKMTEDEYFAEKARIEDDYNNEIAQLTELAAETLTHRIKNYAMRSGLRVYIGDYRGE